jgi:hypothetical protein
MDMGARTSFLPMTPDFTREFPLEDANIELRFHKGSLKPKLASLLTSLLRCSKSIPQKDGFSRN